MPTEKNPRELIHEQMRLMLEICSDFKVYINQLHNENSGLRADMEHWRRVAKGENE